MIIDYNIINRIKILEDKIMACEVCKEKQTEINRILKSYSKDKRLFYIIIAVQMALLVVVTALGKDGVNVILDATIKKFL